MFFDVANRREFAARVRKLHPRSQLRPQRAWDRDPSADEHGPSARLGRWARFGSHRGANAPTRMWHWEGEEDDFVARAQTVLLHFIHPLVAHGGPFCLGFPFSAAALEPRSLPLAERTRLDVEDIGALLAEALTSSPASANHSPFAGGRATEHSGGACRHAASDTDALDAAQRAAVMHACGPARILAPAGSGKTKTLVSRVAELVARGVNPGSILLLAFNTKAAKQLEDRLARHGLATTRRIGLDKPLAAVHCATFNAFAARYQGEVMHRRCRIDTDGTLTRAALRKAHVASGQPLSAGGDRDPVGDALAALTRVRAGLDQPESVFVAAAAPPDSTTRPSFAPLHAEFTRLQAAGGHQSFDDQIYFALVDLLATPVNRRRVQHKYTHVLVDEYQDLNAAQLALVDVLSRPHRRLFVVGDDDQHIYGWRFADPDGILRFHDRVPPPPWSRTYRLATNYRCSRAVVAAADRLIGNNQRRERKEVRPRLGAALGAIHFVAAPSGAQRADRLCAFLREERARLGCDWRELAVLTRYRTQLLPVALALDAAGIPRGLRLAGGLFAHPTARLTRACTALVLAPAEAGGAILSLVLSARGLPPAHVARIIAADYPWAAVARLAAGPDPSAAHPSAALLRLVEGLRAGADLTSVELLQRVVGGFGVLTRAIHAAAASDAGGPLQIVERLVRLAETHPQPSRFVAAWDRLAAEEAAGQDQTSDLRSSTQGERDGVVMSTIHAAKGREYRSVVIHDYDVDVTAWSPGQIEEERRVVYVGVTRAEDSLLLTVDSSRPYVHPFLRELVDRPSSGEYERLRAAADLVDDTPARAAAARRIREIEVLFPELLESVPPSCASSMRS